MSNKKLLIYGVVTLLCGVFSTIYEHFSHGVYSNLIVYLFIIPLMLGVVPELLGNVNQKFRINNSWLKLLQYLTVITLILGSALQGILEIYGTTSHFTLYYFAIGFSLLVLATTIWIWQIYMYSQHGGFKSE